VSVDDPTPWPPPAPPAPLAPPSPSDALAGGNGEVGPWAVPVGYEPVPEPAPPRWGMGDVAIGVGLYLGVQIIASIVLIVGFLVVGDTSLSDLSDPDTAGDFGLWALAVAAPLSWVVLIGWPYAVSRWKGTGRLSVDFGFTARWIDLATGVGGGIVCLFVGAGAGLSFQAVFGDEAPTNTDIIPQDSLTPAKILFLLLIIAVGTPIAEEVFFRGLFLGAARKAWGTVIGVIVSSLGFGLAHIQPTPMGWLYVGVVTGSYGAVFAMLRVFSKGRIGASIIAHMVVNGIGVLAVAYGLTGLE